MADATQKESSSKYSMFRKHATVIIEILSFIFQSEIIVMMILNLIYFKRYLPVEDNTHKKCDYDAYVQYYNASLLCFILLLFDIAIIFWNLYGVIATALYIWGAVKKNPKYLNRNVSYIKANIAVFMTLIAGLVSSLIIVPPSTILFLAIPPELDIKTALGLLIIWEFKLVVELSITSRFHNLLLSNDKSTEMEKPSLPIDNSISYVVNIEEKS